MAGRRAFPVRVIAGLWHRVHRPRVIAVAYFAAYLILAGVGIYALIRPPTSIEGTIGAFSMVVLATLCAFGGIVGAVAVLPGRYWLERLAVIAIAVATVIYAAIILSLQITAPGNRLLQFGFIGYAGLMQLVRWHRIKERPYDPERPPPTTVTTA